VNAKDTHDGRPALAYAALSGHKKAVELLVQAGAEVNAEDNSDKSVLTLAAEATALERQNHLWRAAGEKAYEGPEIVEFLKQHGATE